MRTRYQRAGNLLLQFWGGNGIHPSYYRDDGPTIFRCNFYFHFYYLFNRFSITQRTLTPEKLIQPPAHLDMLQGSYTLILQLYPVHEE